jgi:hypothetical protein
VTQLDELLNDLALAKDCTAAAVLDKLDRADDLVDAQRKIYESERHLNACIVQEEAARKAVLNRIEAQTHSAYEDER